MAWWAYWQPDVHYEDVQCTVCRAVAGQFALHQGPGNRDKPAWFLRVKDPNTGSWAKKNNRSRELSFKRQLRDLLEAAIGQSTGGEKTERVVAAMPTSLTQGHVTGAGAVAEKMIF